MPHERTRVAIVGAGPSALLSSSLRDAGLTNGPSRDVRSKVVPHVAVHAGVPATNPASRLVPGTLATLDAPPRNILTEGPTDG